MAEWQLTGPVLGLSWDGTGYGLDGTVWGGEAIVVDGPRWTRVGHLRTFPLLGGERVAREPRRAALGMLHAMQSESCRHRGGRWFSEQELELRWKPRSMAGMRFRRAAAWGGCSMPWPPCAD